MYYTSLRMGTNCYKITKVLRLISYRCGYIIRNDNKNNLATKLKLPRNEILVSVASLWNICVSLASTVLKSLGSGPPCHIRDGEFGLIGIQE